MPLRGPLHSWLMRFLSGEWSYRTHRSMGIFLLLVVLGGSGVAGFKGDPVRALGIPTNFASPTPRPTITSRPATPRPTRAPTPTPYRSVQDRIRAHWHGNDDEIIEMVRCESGGEFRSSMHDYNHERRGKKVKFHSMFQYTLETWGNAYGVADPHNATVEQQTAFAWELYKRRGYRPWPNCGRAKFGER